MLCEHEPQTLLTSYHFNDTCVFNILFINVRKHVRMNIIMEHNVLKSNVIELNNI